MRFEVPERGVGPLVFFSVVLALLISFISLTNHVSSMLRSLEFGRIRVQGTLVQPAIKTETVERSRRRGGSNFLAKVQATVAYTAGGAAHQCSEVGMGGNLIPLSDWKKWDAQMARGVMTVEVSIDPSRPDNAFITPVGFEDGQLWRIAGLLIIGALVTAAAGGVVVNAVWLVRNRR